MHTIKSNV